MDKRRYNFIIDSDKAQTFDLSMAKMKMNQTQYFSKMIDWGFSKAFNIEDPTESEKNIQYVKELAKQMREAQKKKDIEALRNHIKDPIIMLLNADPDARSHITKVVRNWEEQRKAEKRHIEAF